MFLTRSEYDRGVNTFSPEGRLFQVEYAIEAIKLGSTAVGIQTPTGVLLAVEKRITSPLLEPESIEKIMEIDTHIGCSMSGLTADARTLIDHARIETQSRPYGVALLVAGVDDTEGPVLYHTDPSGTFVRFTAKAIGSGSEGAQTNLQEALVDGNESMTMEQAETLALQTLKQVMEEKINSTNIEIAAVTTDTPFHIYTTEQVEALLTRL